MPFIRYRKYFYLLSLVLVVLSLASIGYFGLRLGVDFVGGSLLEISYPQERPSRAEIKKQLINFDLGALSLKEAGKNGYIVRFQEIDEETHQKILRKLAGAQEQRFESIGPTIGEETKQKSLRAIALVVAMIIVYIAWAFRRISYPVGSWRYGLVAIVALFHDVVITLGFFAVLGYWLGVEVGVPFVAALLTILGYSVNDTIVVFDRIRENLARTSSTMRFPDLVAKSVRETLVRSFNTSLTTVLVLLAVYFLGGETIRFFVLTLMVGIVLGTYSSLALASPLLVSWSSWRRG